MVWSFQKTRFARMLNRVIGKPVTNSLLIKRAQAMSIASDESPPIPSSGLNFNLVLSAESSNDFGAYVIECAYRAKRKVQINIKISKFLRRHRRNWGHFWNFILRTPSPNSALAHSVSGCGLPPSLTAHVNRLVELLMARHCDALKRQFCRSWRTRRAELKSSICALRRTKLTHSRNGRNYHFRLVAPIAPDGNLGVLNQVLSALLFTARATPQGTILARSREMWRAINNHPTLRVLTDHWQQGSLSVWCASHVRNYTITPLEVMV